NIMRSRQPSQKTNGRAQARKETPLHEAPHIPGARNGTKETSPQAIQERAQRVSALLQSLASLGRNGAAAPGDETPAPRAFVQSKMIAYQDVVERIPATVREA